jgi:hypothetical protein
MLLILLTPIHNLFGQNRYFILRNFSGITISDVRNSWVGYGFVTPISHRHSECCVRLQW